MPELTIKIHNLRKSQSDKILALLDIEFAALGVTVFGAKILSGTKGPWLVMPSFMEMVDGEKKYLSAVSLPKELAKAASDAALAIFRGINSPDELEEISEIPF